MPLEEPFVFMIISGIPLEFFAEMATVDRMLQRYDLYRERKFNELTTLIVQYLMFKKPMIFMLTT